MESRSHLSPNGYVQNGVIALEICANLWNKQGLFGEIRMKSRTFWNADNAFQYEHREHVLGRKIKIQWHSNLTMDEMVIVFRDTKFNDCMQTVINMNTQWFSGCLLDVFIQIFTQIRDRTTVTISFCDGEIEKNRSHHSFKVTNQLVKPNYHNSE